MSFPLGSGQSFGGDSHRGSSAFYTSLQEPIARRLSLSLVSEKEVSIASQAEEESDQPTDSGRGHTQVTFEEEGHLERSRSIHSVVNSQVVKIPGFLRYPGHAVRSQKLANMIRQRLSISGLQLGPSAHGKPSCLHPPPSMSLENQSAPSPLPESQPTLEAANPLLPPPPLQVPQPPSIPGVPSPPSNLVPTLVSSPPLPGPNMPGIPAPPFSNSMSRPRSAGFIIPPSRDRRASGAGAGGIPFPGLPLNRQEELNINPFTAAYRNFPESALREVYTFLHEVGKEIESYAYRFLVEQHYHLSENGGNDTSESRVSGGNPIPTASTISSPSHRVRMRQTNYFTMAPKGCIHAPLYDGGDLSGSVGFNLYASHSGSGVFGFGGAHSKSIDSMRSVNEEDGGGDSSPKPKNVLEDYPHCVENNYFLYTEDWFEEFPLPCPIVEAKVVVTTEPPLFLAGMLLDPVSERFLFGGTTFYEEARVLKVSVIKRTSSDASNPKESGIISWINTNDQTREGSTKKFVKILLREYISLSRADEGFIVQTFSLLDANAKADARRNQLVAPSALPKLVECLRAGAVTRAFSLQHVITLKSLQDEALGDMRQSTIPDIPRVPAALKRGESFRSTSLFTSNIVRRYTSNNQVSSTGEKKTNTASNLWLKRRFRHDTAVSNDHYAFLSDENPMRPLFETEMQQNAPMYVKPIDNIKAFLIFFKDTFSFYSMVTVLLSSVRRLQKFFRYTMAKKRRAMNRMLRLWRHLESECRLKLQHYHPVPSSAERIDMIAANVLQPHMITTREYKEALILELWDARREGYRKWCNERVINGYLKQAGATILSQGFRNVIPQVPSPYLRGLLSFAEIEPKLEKAIKHLHHGISDRSQYTRGPTPGSPMRSATRTVGGKMLLTSVEQSKRNRLDDEVHRLFGWYIEPEKLLYESHTRLLKSLKDSVLTMEEVQMEMKNISLERAERRGAIISAEELRAFAPSP